jgi:hypothetical protein
MRSIGKDNREPHGLLALQAALLVAYFGDTNLKPTALEFIHRWFVLSHLEADRIVFKTYVKLTRAHDVLE